MTCGCLFIPKGFQHIAGGRAQRTPPDRVFPKSVYPEGIEALRSPHATRAAEIPPGFKRQWERFRWYRCAQPPAMGCDPSGVGIMMIFPHSQAELGNEGNGWSTRHADTPDCLNGKEYTMTLNSESPDWTLDSASLDCHIRGRAKSMLDRPKMYAGSPYELESLLWLLDEILSRYGTRNSTATKYPRYVDYLRAHDCGSATYCWRQRLDNPNVSEDELWDGLVAAWKEYFENSHFAA